MTEPSGKIVARPMIERACGCLQEFQHYAVDKFRAQRQAKFQRTRCPACVAKLKEAERQAASLPKKGEALQLLPGGTQVSLIRRADGSWAGTLTANGRTVEATGEGLQGLAVTLARLWARGVMPAPYGPGQRGGAEGPR
jgi:hypothetical protein